MADRSTIAAFRFGFGLPLPAQAPVDPAAMLDRLAGPDLILRDHPGITTADALAVLAEVEVSRRAVLKSPDDPALREADKAATRRVEALRLSGTRLAVARALDNPDGLRERLVLFWADHFTTAGNNRRLRALPSALVEDAIRPHLTGRFGDLLEAATLHPAMLAYLSQDRSVGPNSVSGKRGGRGLNENLGREVMELHSLGVAAGYTQDDVRQMAELLTGATFTAQKGFYFEPKWAEPGPETVLGRSYDGRDAAPILAALQDLALHPQTARHLAQKICVHFLSDRPDPDLVGAMAQAYLDSGGVLLRLYEVLLTHPDAWQDAAQKVRQPFEFVVAGLRGLGVTAQDVHAMSDRDFRRAALAPMQAMGQPWQAAPGPDGWPEEPEAWISPARLAARIAWAMAVPQHLLRPLPDPRTLVDTVLGRRASEALIWAAARAESRRDGVGLVFASAEFNRR